MWMGSAALLKTPVSLLLNCLFLFAFSYVIKINTFYFEIQCKNTIEDKVNILIYLNSSSIIYFPAINRLCSSVALYS